MIIVDKQGLSSKVVKQGLSSMAFQVKSVNQHILPEMSLSVGSSTVYQWRLK